MEAGHVVSSRGGSIALRGHAVTFTGDPFYAPSNEVFLDIPDALVLIEDGIITRFGPWNELHHLVPDHVDVEHYPGHVLSAGFVDTHVHYVQTGIIAAFGSQLIDWLNDYTFVEEQRFNDAAYSAEMARLFFDELLRNGTTTALSFCAVYPESVDAFFDESMRRNTRMIAGKVLMDRNAPEALLDTVQIGYDQSLELLERWHGTGRNHYAITPRFAPTSTPGQLEAAGALWKLHPDAWVHTHVSESLAELAWVKSLFPERSSYLDVYDHYGLLGRRAVLAHGVHLSGPERHICHQRECSIAHCPSSNNFLGSGLFHVQQAKDPSEPIHVGLGTDIGAGTSFSMLTTMGEAYKVAALNSSPMNSIKSLFLATLGGARALDLDDRIGSIAVGKEADIVVLDPNATPLLRHRSARCVSIEEQLFVLSVMGDDRVVRATYVAGERAYDRTLGMGSREVRPTGAL
ncbi:MAG: guanine deaminase [Thermoleophilia bacterium]|nr:guanine deaminase [Thermoleophilia bacterium]